MYFARYIRSQRVDLLNIDFEDLHTVKCIARDTCGKQEHNTVECGMPGWDGENGSVQGYTEHSQGISLLYYNIITFKY